MSLWHDIGVVEVQVDRSEGYAVTACGALLVRDKLTDTMRGDADHCPDLRYSMHNGQRGKCDGCPRAIVNNEVGVGGICLGFSVVFSHNFIRPESVFALHRHFHCLAK